MGNGNGGGGPKVTLSLQALIMFLLFGMIGWAATLIWTKADGAAPKEDVKIQEKQIQSLEVGQALIKRDVQLLQEDITETKADVKDVKAILERRFGTVNAPPHAAPTER